MAAGYGLLLINKFPNCMASFQHGVLVPRLTWKFSGAILSNLMPAIHAGMTKICIFSSFEVNLPSYTGLSQGRKCPR
jgi:hypothetical protein